MGRKTVLLIVAVVIASLGASLVYLYVRGVDDRAIAEQAPVQVLTVTTEILAGETVDEAQAAGKLQESSIPSSQLLPGALSSTETIVGQAALTTMFPGEQVIPGKWGTGGAVSTLGIPEDRIAVSAQLGDPNRVAGFVQPGSEVAIWITSGEGAETSVQLLLEQVTVLGAGDTTTTSTTTTDETGTTQTTEILPKTLLTLSVDQEQAEKIILGGKAGELWFGLLTEKSSVTYDEGTSVKDLFE
jgi:pilus assembly protein CpaB